MHQRLSASGCFANPSLLLGPAKALMFLENTELMRHLSQTTTGLMNWAAVGSAGCDLQQTGAERSSWTLCHSLSSSSPVFGDGRSIFNQTLLHCFPYKLRLISSFNVIGPKAEIPLFPLLLEARIPTAGERKSQTKIPVVGERKNQIKISKAGERRN